MKHRPSKTSHIYIFLYKDPKNQAKRSFKEILSSDPPSSKRNVLRRTRFRRLDCPSSERVQKFTVTLKSIMKVYYETVAWLSRVHKPPLLLFFLLFFEKKKWREERSPQGKRNNRRVPRATTWWKDQEREKKKKKKKRRERWWGLQFVARWPSSSPPPLSMPRNQESSRTRPERQPAMRLAFSSKADRGNRLKGEKRGPGRNLLSIGGRTLIVEECSSPGNRVELARSAFRNGKHCCTLYPGLHKPGTPHSANSRGLLSSREFSAQRWFKRE